MPTNPCTHYWLLLDQASASDAKCVNCGDERHFTGGITTWSEEHGGFKRNNIQVGRRARYVREQPQMADEVVA